MEEKRYRRTAAAALALSVFSLPMVLFVGVALDFNRGPSLLEAVWIPAAFLSCVTGIVLGHYVIYRRPVPVETTQETRWAMSAIMMGYVCLIPTCWGLLLVVVLIETPWVIFRSLGKNLRVTILATVVLTLVANLCHAIGGPALIAALFGTLELALFAGAMPLARRSGLSGRDRLILSILFYGLTIQCVVWGYFMWRHTGRYW